MSHNSPTVNPRSWQLVIAIAWAALGCGPSFREARLTQPVSMSPMADATVSVEAGRVFVTDDVVTSGMIDDSALAVELGITNGGAAPYTLSAASISCWMELSPDAPGETLSLTPAGGGEGDFPKGLSLEDQQLGSTTIPPGETRHYWVVFRGYRYAGSDVPRRISVLLPDARGRRIRVVIADPARGQLRWEIAPKRTGYMYGVQNTTLLASGLSATGMAATLSLVGRAGPILWDAGLTTRLMVQSRGGLDSPTSSFSGTGVAAHVTLAGLRLGRLAGPAPVRDLRGRRGAAAAGDHAARRNRARWCPRRSFTAPSPRRAASRSTSVRCAPALSPFPISYSGRALPRWGFRLGYTHMFAGGLNSGGITSTIRFAW